MTRLPPPRPPCSWSTTRMHLRKRFRLCSKPSTGTVSGISREAALAVRPSPTRPGRADAWLAGAVPPSTDVPDAIRSGNYAFHLINIRTSIIAPAIPLFFRYCGRECQIKHWPDHKKWCQEKVEQEQLARQGEERSRKIQEI